MAKKLYNWADGAQLDEHSKRKHKILREYFRKYLKTRCVHPRQERFRLVIVDGFAGAGRYDCGSPGSPIIFLETLKEALHEINLEKVAQGSRPIEIECLIVLNDAEPGVIDQLKSNIVSVEANIKDTEPKLHIRSEYFARPFAEVYPDIKALIQEGKYGNVLFNLDQCGNSLIETLTIRDIISSWKSAEVFLTFAIQTVLAYISPDQEKNRVPLEPQLRKEIYETVSDGGLINKNEWLGIVEMSIFNNLASCAPFASPFSINNPDGWRYWFIHFANIHRARQVYNDVLHENCTMQAHFGRSGLNMLSYDPRAEGELYLFDQDSREAAKKQLYEDIPQRIMEHGDALTVEEFYMNIYNETAAHSDDIHQMMIENQDVKVITASGGERRKPNTIRTDDIMTRSIQRSMFPIFRKTEDQ